MSNDKLPPRVKEVNFEFCFKAFSNSSLRKVKSALRSAASKGRVNLTLYNIYVVDCHPHTEETKRKRPKLLKTRMETWQILAIVGFGMLLVMVIVIYRLHVSKTSFSSTSSLTISLAFLDHNSV